MPNEPKKHTYEELIALLPTRGWRLTTQSHPTSAIDHPSLEEVARIAYENRQKGLAPGVIERAENAFKLDMIELEQLWVHLGLSL